MTTNEFTGVTSFNGDIDMNSNEIKNVLSVNGITPNGGVWVGISDGTEITATTTETSLRPGSIAGSYTFPTLIVGSSYHCVLSGTFESKVGNTLTIRTYGGATASTLWSTSTHTLQGVTGSHFEIEVDMTVRVLGTATVAVATFGSEITYDETAAAFKGSRFSDTNSTTFDTTVANIFDITAEWSSTSASNSMQTITSYMTRVY